VLHLGRPRLQEQETERVAGPIGRRREHTRELKQGRPEARIVEGYC
jgi:hypothetical protein